MPYNNYSAISYGRGYTKVKYDTVTVNDNLWLNNISNIWCGNYRYTTSEQRFEYFDKNIEKLDIFLKQLEPCNISERYKMKKFILTKFDEKIKYSQGTIWIGSGDFDHHDDDFEHHEAHFIKGKVDFQTAIRAICREEIEFALWNYTSKLIENNQDGKLIEKMTPENIDSFRLKWFHYSKFPIKDITKNGFRIGTDDTEFNTIKENINIKKKIFINQYEPENKRPG